MSGSLALTLSRLTILAFGAGLGIAAFVWTRVKPRAEYALAFRDLSRHEQIQRIAFIGLPVLVVLGWSVLALSIGANDFQKRMSEIGVADNDSRLTTIKSALPLSVPLKRSWRAEGWEVSKWFTMRCSRRRLSGRWSRLHSDWLQLALEAGIPALLLALLLTVAWLIAWWRNMTRYSAVRDEQSILLRLAPVAGIFTVLACTAADFPLRETGLALGFFFVAGALARDENSSGRSGK